MLRPGRRVQLVGASLHADDRCVCRLTALRVAPRPRRRTLGGPRAPARPAPSGRARGDAVHARDRRWAELRRDVGRDALRPRRRPGGPVAVWLRLRRPRHRCRGADAADAGRRRARTSAMASAPSSTSRRTTFVNPDLVVHIRRQPAGSWVLLDARTEIEPGGGATAVSVFMTSAARSGWRRRPCSSARVSTEVWRSRAELLPSGAKSAGQPAKRSASARRRSFS